MPQPAPTRPLELRITPNPDPASKLGYLIMLPLGGGLILKAREPWPTTARVYCHRHDGPWPDGHPEEVAVPVRTCTRSGAAIDLVLDRARLNRSQFVITRIKGREAIFWQTPATTRAARPGARVPKARPDGVGSGPLRIVVDTRERYAWKFTGRRVELEREALPAGDYAVVDDAYRTVGIVERKKLDDLAKCLSDGSLAFAVAEMSAAAPVAAVVVEGRYDQLLQHAHAPGAWLADQLARIQARTPRVAIVFCDTRQSGEEYAWRLLAAAYVEHGTRAEDDGQLVL